MTDKGVNQRSPRSRTFDAGKHRKCPLAARLPNLLGCAKRSSPKAASRRAEGAGLDGQGADRAIIYPPRPFPMRRTPAQGRTCTQV
jgi:hypothetical protein